MSCELSVVVPLHNEEGNVQPLWMELQAVLTRTGRSFEVVFINDGSSDGTEAALNSVQESDPRVVVVHLKKNFGQTAGLAAGFDHCRGRIIITMDGDMQHDPRDIPRLLEAMDDDIDIVSGWRRERERVDPLIRRLPSKIANGLARRISGVELQDFGTTFKAYRREVIDELELHGEMHRFIPALASRQGARIVEVPISCRTRHSGTSHYGLARTWSVLIDLMVLKFLVSYFGRPLKAFAALGVPLFAVGFLIAAAVSVQFYFYTTEIGYGNLILAALLMILGVQFLGMGMVAEIGARNYHQANKKSIYSVRRVCRGGPRAAAGQTDA